MDWLGSLKARQAISNRMLGTDVRLSVALSHPHTAETLISPTDELSWFGRGGPRGSSMCLRQLCGPCIIESRAGNSRILFWVESSIIIELL